MAKKKNMERNSSSEIPTLVTITCRPLFHNENNEYLSPYVFFSNIQQIRNDEFINVINELPIKRNNQRN